MGKSETVDQELSALIHEMIDAALLEPASPEHQVALIVADKGQATLDPSERAIWEGRLLPILSKPLHEQIAIAAIIRRGGYVPRKIEF
jgi:hypothetical protein